MARHKNRQKVFPGNRERKLMLFLLPGLAGFTAFYLFPYFQLLACSVWDNPVRRQIVGLSHYGMLLKNRSFLIAGRNMACFSLCGTCFVVLLSLGFSLLLHKCSKMINALFHGICLLPLFVPAACVVIIWMLIFDRYGMMNRILEIFHLNPVRWMDSKWGFSVILIIYLWKYTGLITVLLSGALAAVPADLLETARLEGGRAKDVFLLVELPFILPAVVFSCLFSVTNSFRIFRDIYLLTGDYPPESMYILSHFLNNTLRRMEIGKMSAASILYTALTALILLTFLLSEKRIWRKMEL